jgi:nucleotide-binding universal stress UspA family protein
MLVSTIVVPLDGSEFAAKAIPAATAIGTAAGARLHLVGIARDDTELVWVHDHVHDQAQHVPSAAVSGVDVIVDPDPAAVLLERADHAGTVLCFASHDRMPIAAKVLHAVGSEVIVRARHPFLVVGANAPGTVGTGDVVVALDGVHDPHPVLATAIDWARALKATLRAVTVYEPVLPDLRRPTHFTRGHGPPGDPDEYLDAMAQVAASSGISTSTGSIADPISAAAGLEQHLEQHPASLVVLGGGQKSALRGTGTVRALLRGAEVPLLVVNRSKMELEADPGRQ